MAVDITLDIYDPSDTKALGRHCLYFGNTLNHNALWDGWHWVKEQGMDIDGPWALDNKAEKRGTIVTKAQLSKWIEEGFLSITPRSEDFSADFLKSYPEDSIFRLWFLDWS